MAADNFECQTCQDWGELEVPTARGAIVPQMTVLCPEDACRARAILEHARAVAQGAEAA